MGKIVVWNTNGNEDYSNHPNNFYIGRLRGKVNMLSNPFTFNGKRSNIAKLSFRTRAEALEAYKLYFDRMIETNEEFKRDFDAIYEKYRDGEDVYLQCFCHPQPCHGDYIAEKLQERLLNEMLAKRKG